MKMKTCVYCLSDIYTRKSCVQSLCIHIESTVRLPQPLEPVFTNIWSRLATHSLCTFDQTCTHFSSHSLSVVERRFVTHEIHGPVESNRRILSCTQHATTLYFRCSSNLFLCAFDDTHTLSWAIRIAYIVHVIVEFPCRVFFSLLLFEICSRNIFRAYRFNTLLNIWLRSRVTSLLSHIICVGRQHVFFSRGERRRRRRNTKHTIFSFRLAFSRVRSFRRTLFAAGWASIFEILFNEAESRIVFASLS